MNEIFGKILPYEAKGSFYSEGAIRFSNLQKIFQISILSLKVEFVVSVIGWKFKFKFQDSDLEYFLGDLKNTSHFLKKQSL